MNTITQSKQLNEQIVRHVKENAVTIVNSIDSGNIPVCLAKAGYKVIVTNSEKRLNGYTRVKNAIKEYNYPDAEKLIFYNNIGVTYSKNYHIIFMAYSNKVIKEIMNNKDSNLAVVIEGPCNNINAQVLITFCKELTNSGCGLKLIIINNFPLFNNTLLNFFNNAKILNSPVTSNNITSFYESHKHINELVVNLLLNSSQNNFLVLLAYPKKIERFHNMLEYALQKFDIDAEIFVLYPGILPSKINTNPFKRNIILVADISQAQKLSIDIDVIIDCGIEKNIKVIDGIQTTFLQYTSIQTIEEHKSLAGKYSPGTYWLCSKKNYLGRKKFHKEVERTLDNMILELINHNIQILSSNYLLPKSMYYINSSISLLRKLGAIDDNLQITQLGKNMCKIPISIRFARILIESKKYDAEFDVLIFYILSNFSTPRYILKDGVSTPINSNLIELIDLFKRVYFKIDTPIFDKSSSKCLLSLISTIKNLSTELGITPRYATNVTALKKVIPYGFPDGLYILNPTGAYMHSDSNLQYNICRPSKANDGLEKYVVAFPSNFVDKTINFHIKKGFLSFYIPYSLEEVLMYFSPFLSESHFTDEEGTKVRYMYNSIEITSILIK